jgi:hypothetical protein
MADLHQALQGSRVRQDIYILRNLHRGDDEGVVLLPTSEQSRTPPPTVSPEANSIEREQQTPPPDPKPRLRSGEGQGHGLLTYSFASPPPACTSLQDLPPLVEWFLRQDPLIPNNLEVLEEAHRKIHDRQPQLPYQHHLTLAITDDLRTYDTQELLQKHLALLTTAYARTLHAFRDLASRYPGLDTPDRIPEPDRHRIWELCVSIGLIATRLRVEGWIYQERYGVTPLAKKPRLARTK